MASYPVIAYIYIYIYDYYYLEKCIEHFILDQKKKKLALHINTSKIIMMCLYYELNWILVEYVEHVLLKILDHFEFILFYFLFFSRRSLENMDLVFWA